MICVFQGLTFLANLLLKKHGTSKTTSCNQLVIIHLNSAGHAALFSYSNLDLLSTAHCYAGLDALLFVPIVEHTMSNAKHQTQPTCSKTPEKVVGSKVSHFLTHSGLEAKHLENQILKSVKLTLMLGADVDRENMSFSFVFLFGILKPKATIFESSSVLDMFSHTFLLLFNFACISELSWNDGLASCLGSCPV